MIEFDIILNRIGHLGRYQIFLVFLTYWLGIPAGLHNIASVFTAAPVDFRCNTPPIDNSTIYPGLTEDNILNLTTPYNDLTDKYDGCYRYGYNLNTCNGTYSCVDKDSEIISCDKGYHFDDSQFSSTVETEWNLVCDRKILGTLATSIYFAGMWAGAVVFGYLADSRGRAWAMFWSNIGTLVFGLATAFAPWFSLFVVTRFLVAAFSHGAFLIMCVYVMEITGKKRSFTGINCHCFFAIGYMLNSLIAYFLRDWRWYYFVLSLTPIPYLLFQFFVPESPRWHFSNGRDEKGKEIAHKFAKHNKKKLTEDVWKEAETEEHKRSSKILFDRKYSSLDLFKPPRMRLITFNVMFQWFVVSLIYYGLALNAGSLAGDIYLNNFLNGLMEVFGNILVSLTMDRIGRRLLLGGSLLLGGVACIGSMLFNLLANGDEGLITAGVVLAFVGKFGCSQAFAIMFNFTAELYPTVVRSNGLGVGSMAARWGSILAPFIILTQDYAPWLPSTLFGVLSLIAGVLAFLFPETSKQTMTQTIAQAELFYKGVLDERPLKDDSDDHEKKVLM